MVTMPKLIAPVQIDLMPGSISVVDIRRAAMPEVWAAVPCRAMSTLPPTAATDVGDGEVLPADDAQLRAPDLDLPRLAARWSRYAARWPMTAEQMRGADARAQRFGVASIDLMEQAGAAVAAAARATLNSAERPARFDRARAGRAGQQRR